MKKNIAKRWVKALRSGKYKQGQCLLKQVEEGQVKYCCLGVLCELYNQDMKRNGKKPMREKFIRGDKSFDEMDRYSFGLSDHLLPQKIRRWAGMRFVDGQLYKPNSKPHECGTIVKINSVEYDNLSGMNDDGLSFKRIATVIERNVDNL